MAIDSCCRQLVARPRYRSSPLARRSPCQPHPSGPLCAGYSRRERDAVAVQSHLATRLPHMASCMHVTCRRLIRRASTRPQPSLPPARRPGSLRSRYKSHRREQALPHPPGLVRNEKKNGAGGGHAAVPPLVPRGLRSLRRDLRSARWDDDPAQLSKLVNGFVSHFSDYCAARAETDPVWTLAAPWATPVERGAAYWLAGWRPTTLVHILYTESSRRFEAQLPDLLLGVRSGNLGDLSPSQLAQIDELQRRTVAEEDELSREMAAVQEGHGAVGADGELDVDGSSAASAPCLPGRTRCGCAP
ncbi:hypothetical protein ACQ4PT_029884 [Festuca glaucescens]